MRRSLKLHPDCACEAVTRVEVEVVRRPGRLALLYRVSGPMDVLLPRATAPERANSLWQHTCFEAFIHLTDEAYLELNFAPSTQWAAYRFDSYRDGMRKADMRPPRIDVRTTDDSLELEAEFDLPGETPVRLGLSAVIEEKNGTKSYWALAHPPGDPDFHHPDCFALELPAPDAP